MVKKEVMAKLVDPKKTAILRVLLGTPEELYLKEIAQQSQVPMSSTFRILQQLATQGFITRREWKTSTLYSCPNNEKVSFLKELFLEERDGITDFVSSIQKISEIERAILHGPRKKDKANLLLLGNNIPVLQIESACQQARQQGCDLSYVALTNEQFQQLVKMGLYAGEKEVIFEKVST